jgi:HAD superfamily hydrolase (TIGR01493 family)
VNTYEEIKCLAFDVFGTLVEIADKRSPYRQLLRAVEATGRPKKKDDASRVMSSQISLADYAELLQTTIPKHQLASLEKDLQAELESVRLFPEVITTLKSLRAAGYKIAVCSNLAWPYAAPVQRLLPFELDTYAWSFEVGAIKPDPVIYNYLSQSLQCAPSEILMVGDTIEADYDGPKMFGMNALHLSRNRKSRIADSIKSIDQIFVFLNH